MTNIYDELRASHAKQRRLCSGMVRTLAKNHAKREALFRELRIELAAHAAAEERYLYVPILMYDMGLNSARHALSEHHAMDHLKEEETKFFQVSGKLLSPTRKARLAEQYRKDYERMLVVVAER